MAIQFHNDNDLSFNLKNKRILKTWINEVIKSYKKETGEINYIFCSDEKILEINKTFLKHNYYTDIISFDYSEDQIISGDLYISIETVKSNSIKFKTSYIDELNRVIIHGILHFIGFKDKSTKDVLKMREAENEALNKISLKS